MKKISMMLILVLVCVMVLSACGSDNKNSSATNDSTTETSNSTSDNGSISDSNEKQVELEVAFWGDKSEIEVKSNLLKEFQKQNPNIKIKETYTDGGTYQTKLQVWFSSNTAPDVLGIAADLIYPYKDLGVIEDLTPYMQKDDMLNGDVWESSAIDAFTFDGKVLAAPYICKTMAIAYNKDLFDEAGVPYPTADWTEEEMIDMARKLTKGTGPEKQWGIRLCTYPTNFYRNMFGQPVYDVEQYKMNAAGNEQFVYSFDVLSSIVKEGLSPNETFENILSSGFESGKFAMAVVATWDMNTFDKLIGDRFEWDVQVLPMNKKFNKRWQGYLFADGFTMSAQSEHKDEAWEVVKWLTADYEAQKASSVIGVPMLKEYANSDEYLNEYTTNNHYNKKVFVDMLKDSVSGQTTGVWAQINDELNKQFQRVVAGEIDVETAVNEIQAKGEQILTSSKK